jgi:hypothetical protein
MSAGLVADSFPLADLAGADGVQARVVTWAPEGAGAAVVQEWRLHNPGPTPVPWQAAFTGPLRLGRAAMTELVEGGVLPDPPAEIEAEAADGVLLVVAPAAGVAAAVAGLPTGAALSRRAASGHLEVRLPIAVDLEPGASQTLVLPIALGTDPARVTALARRLAAGDAGLAVVAARREDRLGRIDPLVPAVVRTLGRRALGYVLDCCALAMGEATCVLTDHRVLPLSWNRDGWFAVQALVAAGVPGAEELAGRHLRWLFEVAERPGRAWGRAYLPSGRVKDPAYQLDQQCWPLLELAGQLDRTWDASLAAAAGPVVDEVLAAIAVRRAAGAELFATEETPGDDPVPMPYHFSSHVLLWHTLHRLANVLGRPDLAALADRVRVAVRTHLTTRQDGREMFAYAADLEGGQVRYHDANDLPAVLAPVWGFCPADDPVWRATMAFAFSPDNPGFAAGPLGGLGSVHTPGAWPLGDVQELIWAQLAGDNGRATRVLGRLAATACWDGALPEARDPGDGTVRSRHWFAWPGAALVCALVPGGWA